MRRFSFITLVGALSLLAGSCQFLPGGEGNPPDSVATSPSPSTSPTPTTTPTPQKPFNNPTVEPKSPPAATAVPGLVQSTNPDERVRQIQKGRRDPFGDLSYVPQVEVSPSSTGGSGLRPVPPVPNPGISPGTSPGTSRPRPNPPRTPNNQQSSSGGRRTPTPPRTGSTNRSRTPQTQRPSPPPIARGPAPNRLTQPPTAQPVPTPPPFVPELPPLPEPDLARAVEVSGVIQVGGEPHAIIKAPNEATSRYVRVGQRLSNGQILVKRIDMSGPMPVVILEQYGIEIAKRVGEEPAQANQGPGTPAQLPRPAAAVPIPRA